MTESVDQDPKPTPPEKPLPGECCAGGSCCPCVYDTYYDAVDLYDIELKAWTERHPEESAV